jgi:hypothetical protein
VLKYIIWLIAEKRPLMFIALPGFFMVILGLLIGIYTLQYYNITHVFLVHYAIFVSMLLILGAFAMFMGIVLGVLPNIIKKSKQEVE